VLIKPISVSTLALFAGATQADNTASWDVLASIEIEEIVSETSYEVRKVFPAAMKDGIAQFDITGYAVPMSFDGAVSEILLVSDMGFCPFCGSPEHGTSLQVSLASPILGLEEGTRITVRGQLDAIIDPETFQSAIMRDATVIDG